MNKEYIDKQELLNIIEHNSKLEQDEFGETRQLVAIDIKSLITFIHDRPTYTQADIVAEYAKEDNAYLAHTCEDIGYKKGVRKFAEKLLEKWANKSNSLVLYAELSDCIDELLKEMGCD